MSFNLPLWLLSLVLIGAPTGALMLDRIKEYPAPKFIRVFGIPALAIFVILVTYLSLSHDPLLDLLVWGAVGGLAGTLTLDVVRLLGVQFNAFPVDMPQMFGAMALGVAPKLPKHVMARMVSELAEIPDSERKKMMEPRILAISQLPLEEGKVFMKMMMEGIKKLPQEKREKVMKTQMEILASLPEDKRMKVMSIMDSLMFRAHTPNGVALVSPMSAFRTGIMPKLEMGMFRNLVGKWGVHSRGKAMDLAAQEAGVSSYSLVLAGYLWHAINGASYGMAYTLLFGSGSWLLAFAWGTFVWAVMMASMPKMMPMVKLPYPKFMVVPLLAHWAMAVPIGYFALAYLNSAATSSSLLGWLAGI